MRLSSTILSLSIISITTSVRITNRGPKQVSSSSGVQEKRGGLQLPSLSLWPWSTSRQHRAATVNKLKYPPQPQLLKKPLPVAHRRQEIPDKRLTPSVPASASFYKKPTGLEKKPFGPKYSAKINPKYQNYNTFKQKTQQKVRLAPIPDLRPTSIDRIDILRPQNLPSKAGRIFPKTRVSSSPPSSKAPVRQSIGSGIKIVNKSPSPVKINKNPIISFTEAPVEVNGLKLFMFRGDEGIGGSDFKPFKPVSGLASQVRPPQFINRDRSIGINNNNQFQWSKAEIRPKKVDVAIYNTTPRYAVNDVAPPFPTRHTTPSPHVTKSPIVIIAQSNVAQN